MVVHQQEQILTEVEVAEVVLVRLVVLVVLVVEQ